MVDQITTNPKRNDRLVNEEGLPTRQIIEWFDDIELKINELAAGGGGPGSGDFSGPDGAIPENLVSFENNTGKLGKDSGIATDDVVEAETTADEDNIVLFANDTGRRIKDSGVKLSDIGGDVNGPNGAVDGNVPSLDATGKILSDSGKSAVKLVEGPDEVEDNRIVLFDSTTGKLIKDSGKTIADLGDVDGPATSNINNIATFSDLTGKEIKDSGINIGDVGNVDGPASSVANNLVSFLGASGKVVQDSGKSATNVVTNEGAGTENNLAAFDNNSKKIKDSGLPITNVGDVKGPASSVNDRIAIYNGTTGKIIKDSGKTINDLGDVDGPGSSVNNRIASYDGTTGKIIKDSGKLVTDVVTGPGSSVNNRIATYNGATGKIIKDSGVLISSLGDVDGPASAVNNRIATFNGTNGKVIKDSGFLTSSFAPAFRGALVYKSVDQSIAHNTIVNLTWNLESYDTSGIHSGSSVNLTVPAGVTKIILRGCVTWNDSGTSIGNRNIAIFKNGASFIGFPQVVGPGTQTGLPTIQNIVSPVLTVSAGNNFTLLVFQTSTISLFVGGGAGNSTWFSMELIQ